MVAVETSPMLTANQSDRRKLLRGLVREVKCAHDFAELHAGRKRLRNWGFPFPIS
jgi:hypothetical protein